VLITSGAQFWKGGGERATGGKEERRSTPSNHFCNLGAELAFAVIFVLGRTVKTVT